MKSVKTGAAIEEYLAHLRAKRLAENTVKQQTTVLRRARKVWGDILISSIEPRHIDRLFTDGGWAPGTQNLYLGTIRQFFKWCRLHSLMGKDFDPTATWGNARLPRNQDRNRIPVEQFKEILDAAQHPRDRAIIALGLYTFARGSEISLLKVHDLNLTDGLIHLYRVKTLDEDDLPISSELQEEMGRWLNWYRKDQGTLRGTWYLTPAKQPNPYGYDPSTRLLTPLQGLAHVKPEVREARPYRAVQRALRALGQPSLGEGVHTLRRSSARAYADHLRSEGYDGALLRTASFLGHRSTKVTEHYIGWGLERDQRNKMVKGQPMFPEVAREPGLRIVGGTDGRDRDQGV